MTQLFDTRKEKVAATLFAILFGAVFIFCFLTMDYVDGRINANNGYSLCRALLEGHYFEQYNAMDLSYGITIYSLYMIWSFPVVIIDKIMGRTTDIYTSIASGLWYKLFLGLFAFLCIYFTYRIIVKLTDDKKRAFYFAVFLMTYSIMFFPPIVLTQCDVIALSFSLMGVNYLLEGKNKKFIACFAFAATMKYFALFIFVPLLIYKYKKIGRLTISGIYGISLVAVQYVLQSLSATAVAARDNEEFYVNEQVDRFNLDSAFHIGSGYISFMIVFFLGLCLLLHLTNPTNEKENRRWILWIGVAGWYTLFLFYSSNTYWYVLLAPFLVLLLLNAGKDFGFAVLLEIVMVNCFLVDRVISQSWVFGGKLTFTRLVLKNRVNEAPDLIQAFLIKIFGTENLISKQPLFLSVACVCAFGLLYICRPRRGTNDECNGVEQIKLLKVGSWLNLFILLGWVGIMVLEQFYVFG